MLKKLFEIQDGKIISVGSHTAKQYMRPKSLHKDRNKIIRSEIQQENGRLQYAIETARSLVPLHNDRKSMGK